MSLLLKAIYRFNVISIKIPKAFFTGIEKTILKSVWKHKKPTIAKATLNKRNKAKGMTLLTSDSATKPYKAIVIKTAWYWTKADM